MLILQVPAIDYVWCWQLNDHSCGKDCAILTLRGSSHKHPTKKAKACYCFMWSGNFVIVPKFPEVQCDRFVCCLLLCSMSILWHTTSCWCIHNFFHLCRSLSTRSKCIYKLEGSRRVQQSSITINWRMHKQDNWKNFLVHKSITCFDLYIYVNIYSEYICMCTKGMETEMDGLEEILIHTYTLKGAMIVSDAGLEGRSAWRWLVWYSKYEVPLTVNRKLNIVTMYTVNALPWKSWPASFSATFLLCFIFWLSATITMQSITSCVDNNKWTYIQLY